MYRVLGTEAGHRTEKLEAVTKGRTIQTSERI